MVGPALSPAADRPLFSVPSRTTALRPLWVLCSLEPRPLGPLPTARVSLHLRLALDGRKAASPARPRRGPGPPFRHGYGDGMGCALEARRQQRLRSLQFPGTGPCRFERLPTYRLGSEERPASARRPRPRSKRTYYENIITPDNITY